MAVGTVINGLGVRNVTPMMATLAREINVRIPEMVRVAGGTFSMGSTMWEASQPIRQVTMSDFAIGKYPVTNGEYRGYLEVMGKDIPTLVANKNLAMHPVVNVPWKAATKYCKFLMEATGRKFGLPTEAQWEFAARGTEGRTYPWGNESYEGHVNFNSKGTTPVDAHPLGATPSGIFDMAGNVWEWTMDWYADRYNAKDLVNPKGPENENSIVLRGGSWCYDSSDVLMAAFRNSGNPERQNFNVGFRLAEHLG